MSYSSELGYTSKTGYASFTGYLSSIGYNPVLPPVSFDRQWFIETSGDEHGYSIGVIGSLTPDDWFNLVDIVDRLFVDGSSSALILQSSVDGLWDGQVNIDIEIEGFGTVTMNWNSATAYVLTDSVLRDFIIANVGNTLGLNILPRP